MKGRFSSRIPGRAAVVALLILTVAVGVALALTMSNADGKWSNVQPVSGTTVGCLNFGNPTQWSTNVNTYQDSPNNTDENQVRWGDSGGGFFDPCGVGTSQSGFGFDGNNGPLTFNAGDVVLLGKFVHYNNPVTFPDGAEQRPASMNLAVTLNFSDPAGLNPLLNYNVLFDETSNSANPCPYGDSTGNGCDDRVTFPPSVPDQTFNIDGVPYTLQITGFVPDTDGVCPAAPAGATSRIYTTGENRTNYACLYARIVLPIDSGDAPDLTLGQTTGAGRARHNITSTGPYLGALRGDGEVDGQPNATATGDDTADSDDEDGFVSMDTNWGDGGSIVVSVTRGSATGLLNACVYAWIDWQNNGFGVGNDSTAQGVRSLAGNGTITLSFAQDANMPDPGSFPATTVLRLRVKANSSATCPTLGTAGNLPTGLWTDGEVEDHRLTFMPLAVDLASFTAAAAAEGVTLSWETVSEANNAGFNVYRSESAEGPWVQLNAALIPAATPGSSQGNLYAWADATAAPGAVYFYVLEDVTLDGTLTRYDPISVTLSGGPNAVGLAGFAATATGPGLAGLATVALAALAGHGLRRPRS